MKNPGEEFLTLMHYKEPLRKVKDGYGYYGALQVTKDKEYLQCHVCGELFKSVATHINYRHKMNSEEYREKYDLAYQTALVSEAERLRRSKRQQAWMKTAPKSKLKKIKTAAKKAHTHRKTTFQPKMRLETRNKRGTCPDQLVAKIKQITDQLGRTPSLHEFVAECGTQRYKHQIYTVFGSWKNALKIAKLDPAPHYSGKGKKKKRYTDEELLEYLVIFTQENNTLPTSSACRRSFLPGEDVYARRFGSLVKAREIANCSDHLD